VEDSSFGVGVEVEVGDWVGVGVGVGGWVRYHHLSTVKRVP
jgi:hypothetical protein